MEKVEFVSSANNEEHLERHSASTSLTVGSKALDGTSKDDIAKMLNVTDQTYQSAIEAEGTPGRIVYGFKADKPIGTDAVISAENLMADSIFNIVREPGTRGEAKVKVAIINKKDMPRTSVAHAIYGNYGPTGKAGIYTMIFGDPGEPFPGEHLPKEVNEKAEKYWNGEDGKGGHVFLTTPEELSVAIQKMEEAGLSTTVAESMLNKFKQNSQSPVLKREPSQIASDAKNLGIISLGSNTPVLSMKRGGLGE
ncbi:MAG: hypothetical protein R3Y43_02985 [Alphaproteobacteria bacterium]